MPDLPAIDRLAADADRLAAERRRVPSATYRLQMHAGFTLADALKIVPYLNALGISHGYTSSVLTAKAGSTHGYDVVDPSRLNPELGTDADLEAWVAGLRERGMGWVLDTVPNHMSVSGSNDWWLDVLEHGPASPFASYFDIAWDDHPRERLHGKVLLPILGRAYGAEIEAGRFRVEFVEGTFNIRYGDLSLPVDPRTYGAILGPALDVGRETFPSRDAGLLELQSILTAVRDLPGRDEADPERLRAAWDGSRGIKRRLADLCRQNRDIARLIQDAARRLSGVPDDPASFTALEELLDAQAHRPSHWRVASDEINYRRFFDINDLAALSTEREEVFADVHGRIFDWVAAGQLDGLRIDHPDGLFDPKQYLERLQLYARLAAARHLLQTRPADYPGLDWAAAEGLLRERFSADPRRTLYVVVEKILGEGEPLPGDWATDGTTGYDFINLVNGLFVDPDREPDMTRVYEELTHLEEPFEELVYRSKFRLLQTSLSGELHMLAHQLDRLAQSQRWSRDFTLNGLRHALREVIACFPVYRSYVDGTVSDQDRKVILRGIARARRRNPLLGRTIFDFIRDTLLQKDPPSGPAPPEYKAAQRRFAGKFQQVTAPTMAKGFEDTALYVYARLLSLNEVGGEPARFGRPPAEVHRQLAERAAQFPGAMSPLSTHDTKRSEDVRARLNVLSEIPAAWRERVQRWMDLNRPLKIDVGDGQLALDANEEYFYYQTLVGAWPIGGLTDENRAEFVARLQAYMRKALNEAKVNTSWINPSPDYDEAAAEFVARTLDPERAGDFLRDFRPFQEQVSHWGMFNALAQTLVRATAPGVPDTYQGTELWDFSLVDPDNRRRVDYGVRASWLADLDARAATDPLGLCRELVEQKGDGGIKLYLMSRAFRARRDHANLFAKGRYIPVDVVGPQAGHVFCFIRTYGERSVLVVIPRLLVGLLASADRAPIGAEVWGNTTLRLPEGYTRLHWKNELTGDVLESGGEGLPVAQALCHFPVALLSHV